MVKTIRDINCILLSAINFKYVEVIDKDNQQLITPMYQSINFNKYSIKTNLLRILF